MSWYISLSWCIGGRPRASSVRGDFLPAYGSERMTSGMSRERLWAVGSGGWGVGISRVLRLFGMVVGGGDGVFVVVVVLEEGFRRVEQRGRGVVVGVGFFFRR